MPNLLQIALSPIHAIKFRLSKKEGTLDSIHLAENESSYDR